MCGREATSREDSLLNKANVVEVRLMESRTAASKFTVKDISKHEPIWMALRPLFEDSTCLFGKTSIQLESKGLELETIEAGSGCVFSALLLVKVVDDGSGRHKAYSTRGLWDAGSSFVKVSLARRRVRREVVRRGNDLVV